MLGEDFVLVSNGCWGLDIVPPGVPDSKEHLVTIDNNALWRNPRVVECPGALVSLLLTVFPCL